MGKTVSNIRMSIKNLLLKTARSRFGGSLVCFSLRYCLGIISLKTAVKSKKYVMLCHPAPAACVHYIIVPRFRAADISALLAGDDEWAAFAEFVKDSISFADVSLCCNYGVRQEVGQVHFHVMDKMTLEPKDSAAVEYREINSRQAGFNER